MSPKLKLLIIDDEEELAVALSQLLQLEGYDVDYTTSPLKALDMIRHQKYHIIFSDIVMPEMDGLELLVQIKNYDPLAQIVMMTGYSTMEKTMRSMEAGASDYLLKPFPDLTEVLETVKIAETKLNRWWKSMRGNMSVR